MNNKNRYLAYNGIASLIQQIIILLCGLVVPKLIITTYGSAANGMISSISQFISITAIFQGGVYSAARIAFYKPVAKQDTERTSIVFKTSSLFFKKFAAVLFVYIGVLGILYPILFHSPISYIDTLFLVIIIGMGSVFEYLFGAANQLLLFANQKAYINTLLLTACTFGSAICSVILINFHCPIIYVKLFSAVILLVRPLVLKYIVDKKYFIDKNAKADKTVLNQSNAALSKSISFYIHTSTDTVVITAFMNMYWVSVYAVHKYVVGSVSSLVSSILGNTEATFGHMLARNDQSEIERDLPQYDLMSKMLSGIFFTTCMILITQFVNIYTLNVNDATYYQPVFAILYSVSELIYCMSLTYNNMIMAAGHMKQTQWISICEALINIVISVVLVNYWGIVGVAFGTILAFVFNTVANIIYMRKNIYKMSLLFIMKSYIVNILSMVLLIVFFKMVIYLNITTYIEFIINAVIVFAVSSIFILGINYVFFKKYLQAAYIAIYRKILRKVRYKR